jgi:radical SAM protein with 4Fe4S-binding SPASM domain
MKESECPKLYAYTHEDGAILLDVGNHNIFHLQSGINSDVLFQFIDNMNHSDDKGLSAIIEEIIYNLKSQYNREKVLTVLNHFHKAGIITNEKKAIENKCPLINDIMPIRAITLDGSREEKEGKDWITPIIDFILENHQTEDIFYLIFTGNKVHVDWEIIKNVINGIPRHYPNKKFKIILEISPAFLHEEILSYLNKNLLSLKVKVDMNEKVTQNRQYLKDLIMKTNGKVAFCLSNTIENTPAFTLINYLINNGGKLFFLDTSERYQIENTCFEMFGNNTDTLLKFAGFTDLLFACHLGKFRLYGCQAGHQYLAANYQGEFYPCHKFINNEQFQTGCITRGFIKEKQQPFIDNTIEQREGCRGCWARYFCGGGCSYNNWYQNNHIGKSSAGYCSSFKKQLRKAITIYYSLNEQEKKNLEIRFWLNQKHKPYLAYSHSLYY